MRGFWEKRNGKGKYNFSDYEKMCAVGKLPKLAQEEFAGYQDEVITHKRIASAGGLAWMAK